MPFSTLPTHLNLQRVRVRLIKADDRAHHYLGFVSLAGRSLRYVAEIDGPWLALLDWASPALKVTSRDNWIGWSLTLQWQRLALIANAWPLIRYFVSVAISVNDNPTHA